MTIGGSKKRASHPSPYYAVAQYGPASKERVKVPNNPNSSLHLEVPTRLYILYIFINAMIGDHKSPPLYLLSLDVDKGDDSAPWAAVAKLPFYMKMRDLVCANLH